MTFADSGEYCVGYNLQDSSYNTLIDTNYVQFSVTDGVEPVIGEIEVERVPTLTDDFIMGMDISSAPSLFDAGWYTLECKAMGFANDTVALRVLNEDGGILAEGEPVSLTGWTQNPSEYLDSKVAFEIKEPTNVLLQVELGVQDGGWGSVDSLYLHKHQHVGEERFYQRQFSIRQYAPYQVIF
ncbi:MAG: hypothetical protein Q4A32_02085 [Lachnospiraceae bacterium]|nr:hypothetical protein [Lachnospiraceae bacterium]